MEKIKVLIVEDDPFWINIVLEQIKNSTCIDMIGVANNKEEAVRIALNTKVDVIIMDINLSCSRYDGIYAAAEILEKKEVKIIMLTCLEDEEVIIGAFTAGAINYITKDNYKEIENAIYKTINYGSPIEVLLKDYNRLKEEEQLKPLTPSEQEVLKLLEKGYTQTQIANILYVTKNTLKKHVTRILNKFGVSSSSQAVRKLKTKGMMPSDKWTTEK
ncbi:MAG TPA: response regulator transcription factor [Clostridia bacterium]